MFLKCKTKFSHVCRICGAAVREGEKICECCAESFALCDMEDFLRTDRRQTAEIYPQTLPKTEDLW